MGQNWEQIKAILYKNHLENKRKNEYIKDLLVPMFSAIFFIINGTLQDGNTIKMIMESYIYVFGPMSTIMFLRNFIYTLVNEKYEKYKETYKIMGMKQQAYFLSWLIFTLAKGLLMIIVIAVPAILSGSFQKVGNGYALCIFLFFLLSQVAFAYFVTTFFSKPKLAQEVYSLIALAQIFLFYLFYINYVREHIFFYYLFCLFPSAALNISLVIGNNSFGQFQDFGGGQIVLMLAIDTIFYFTLYLYLDEVFPNEFGTQKKWHFPISTLYRKFSGKNKQSLYEKYNINKFQPIISLDEQGENNYQDYSSAQYHEVFDSQRKFQKSVEIQKIKKNFGDFCAVDEVSLCLYEEQIFCLLGHNGAGKTTTINLLTGMMDMTSGKAQLYKRDLVSQLDLIRQDTGICNQKDVLYDYLSVKEHLQFICQIKGIQKEFQDEKIFEIIQKCNLEMEKEKFVKHLSGGNKRKLSLAIALIGGSKIVFLDEPSSGLDPGSRRKIWDILKQCKKEKRTIVLTTHHLEEAEELADRIGIMSRGKLLTVGSSEFVKRKFGIGYQLSISKNFEQKKQQKQQLNLEKIDYNSKFTEDEKNYYKKLIFEYIQTAQYNPQSSQDKISFVLPFDERPRFPQFLRELENDSNILINLEMNSLEDAFVNIGMEEEQGLESKKKQEEMEKLRKKNQKDFESLQEQEMEQVERTKEKNLENAKYLENEINLENTKNFKQKKNLAKFSDFEKEGEILEVLQRAPKARFWVQFYALFLRKFYTTFRSKGVVFSLIMPFFFIFMGVFIAKFMMQLFDQKDDLYYLMGGLDLSVFLIIGYGFSSGSYCAFIVNEKQNKLKYALNVMGCRGSTYWLGSFAFDYSVFLFLQVIYIVFCYGFNFSFVVDKIFWNLIIMMGFGFSLIAFCYLQSFLYKSEKSALGCSFFLNLYVFYGLFFATMFIGSKFLNSFLAALAPFYLLFYAICCVGQGNYQFVDQFVYMNESYVYVLIYILQGIVYLGLVQYIDSARSSLTKSSSFYNDSLEQLIGEEDSDMKKEENRLKIAQDIVKVQNLTKVYSNGFTALKNTSFGVNSGQIFGLLGPNGAGKSTQFNILTQLIKKTSGQISMKGIEVQKIQLKIYENVGICAQFDCLWESLSVWEHLELFGRMKGLGGSQLRWAGEYFLAALQLEEYRGRRARALSGGNKRKLGVAVALIGGPDMQFFDEPSTGVDPIAKRFLWNTLTNSLKLRNSSIVITTHSMQEADSLCSKIGILVNGQFQCIGSSQYLKNKYGEGYIVSFKTNLGEKKLKNIIQKKFPQAYIQVSQNKDQDNFSQFKQQNQIDKDNEEEKQEFDIEIQELNQKQFNYFAYVKFPYQGFSFSETFEFFERELFERNSISDFNVTQSSLEQIFLELSKNQKVLEENKDFKEKRKFLCMSC